MQNLTKNFATLMEVFPHSIGKHQYFKQIFQEKKTVQKSSVPHFRQSGLNKYIIPVFQVDKALKDSDSVTYRFFPRRFPFHKCTIIHPS